MMNKKLQAQWDALPQEEKDKFDANAKRAVQEVKKAQDESKAIELRKAYNDDPELWRSKKLLRTAVSTIGSSLEKSSSQSMPSVEVTLTAYYDGKVRALSKPTDTELELGLVELLAAACVRLQLIELYYSAVLGRSIAVQDFWNRNLEGAQRRVRKASVDLARVRRLALPILLLNYAERQQVNVGFVSKAPKGKAPKGETQ